jgi:hypothetical protein
MLHGSMRVGGRMILLGEKVERTAM